MQHGIPEDKEHTMAASSTTPSTPDPKSPSLTCRKAGGTQETVLVSLNDGAFSWGMTPVAAKGIIAI
jgi:hypothetical protein